MLSDVCDADRFVELFVDRVKNIKRDVYKRQETVLCTLSVHKLLLFTSFTVAWSKCIPMNSYHKFYTAFL